MKHTFEWLLFGVFVLFNRMVMLAPASLAMPALHIAPRPALLASEIAEMASRRNPRLTLLITEPHAAP